MGQHAPCLGSPDVSAVQTWSLGRATSARNSAPTTEEHADSPPYWRRTTLHVIIVGMMWWFIHLPLGAHPKLLGRLLAFSVCLSSSQVCLPLNAPSAPSNSYSAAGNKAHYKLAKPVGMKPHPTLPISPFKFMLTPWFCCLNALLLTGTYPWFFLPFGH